MPFEGWVAGWGGEGHTCMQGILHSVIKGSFVGTTLGIHGFKFSENHGFTGHQGPRETSNPCIPLWPVTPLTCNQTSEIYGCPSTGR